MPQRGSARRDARDTAQGEMQMRASAIEFRLRMWIQVVIVFLGFWAPWIGALDLSRRISTLEWLALEISRTGLLRFTSSTPFVILLCTLIAAMGAVLRVWGAAYLGYGTVHHAEMQAGSVMAAGPYRYMRNPLYLGGLCMMAAMAFLMPPTGALFVMVLVSVFYLRLILGEEAFLSARLSEPYQQYLRAVPRIVPRLHAALPSAPAKPNWPIAVLTEINAIGIFLAIAILSWTYNNLLMIKAVLVSFGVSLVVRALMPGSKTKTEAA